MLGAVKVLRDYTEVIPFPLTTNINCALVRLDLVFAEKDMAAQLKAMRAFVEPFQLWSNESPDYIDESNPSYAGLVPKLRDS